jgi:hypothetical protein
MDRRVFGTKTSAPRRFCDLASLQTGDDEPSKLAVQQAKRDIIGRCIYGIDKTSAKSASKSSNPAGWST